MVAQRATTTRRAASTRAAKAARRQALRSDGGVSGESDPVAGELARLQAMRAEALSWVAEIERRIEELQLVMFRSEGIGG